MISPTSPLLSSRVSSEQHTPPAHLPAPILPSLRPAGTLGSVTTCSRELTLPASGDHPHTSGFRPCGFSTPSLPASSRGFSITGQHPRASLHPYQDTSQTGLRVHPTLVRVLVNLITTTKTLFPSKITFIGTGGHDFSIFGGMGGHPI